MMLSCRKIKKSFGDFDVLLDINIVIEQGQKLGIVGKNGAGKTTLINIIQGKISADSGDVKFYNDKVKIAYLMQSAEYQIINYDGAFSIDEETGDYEQIEVDDFLRTTSGTGLKKVGQWSEERFSNLSGGEKTKLALSKIWISRPDILILDEPTNHMDVKGIEWLVGELDKFNGTCIIVSHDRYFLDKTVKRIVEIEDGRVNDFNGNYTYYREEKKRRFEDQLNQYLLQEKYKAKIEGQIAVLKEWSVKAHRESTKKEGFKEYYRVKAKKKDIQIKSRIKRLKKIDVEGVEKPKEELGVNFAFEQVKEGGKRLLEAKDISKSFEGKTIFKNSSFYIGRGEKVGIIGPNGCGKTTFLKMIMKEAEPNNGELWISQSAKIAYLSQENKEENDETTLYMLLLNLYPERFEMIKARNLLVSMGIDEKSIATPFNELSYGERVRVRIANMILGDNDLLVLDEPTNHLDLYSREKLEEAILNYGGTVIFVSHDRYALANICQKLLVFEGKRIKRYEGNYEEYVEREEKKQKEEVSSKAQNNVRLDKNKRMVLELKIARVLGRLSMLKQGEEEYEELDREYKSLILERR